MALPSSSTVASAAAGPAPERGIHNDEDGAGRQPCKRSGEGGAPDEEGEDVRVVVVGVGVERRASCVPEFNDTVRGAAAASIIVRSLPSAAVSRLRSAVGAATTTAAWVILGNNDANDSKRAASASKTSSGRRRRC